MGDKTSTRPVVLETILGRLVKDNVEIFKHGIETACDVQFAQAPTFRLEYQEHLMGDFLRVKDSISEATFRIQHGEVHLLYGVNRHHLAGQIAYLTGLQDPLADSVAQKLSLDPQQSPNIYSVIVEVPKQVSYEKTIFDFMTKHMRGAR